MIEVTAKLVNGSTFFSGEVIECLINFSNPSNPNLQKSQSYSDLFETLAWASAQIHCQCSINEKFVLSDKIKVESKTAAINADTTFAPWQTDNGHAILNTKPKILFCDLKLSPEESKSYIYKETIPNLCPPSYRGQAVKYSYKITIGTQRVNSPIKLLRLPFRVMSLRELPESTMCNDSVDLSPNNPFLETQKETPLEIALQTLQNITARRSPNFYNITNGRGKIVRFCLFKNSYKLGEDIVGTFDFSNSMVNCTQVSVTLQSEEKVDDDFKRGKSHSTLTSYHKFHEFCVGYDFTYLILPIPFHITPDFSTELVSLKWRLHFEFVTTEKSVKFPDEQTKTWTGPALLEVETMVWDLPIHVYPTTIPQNIAQVVKNSMII